MGYWEDLNRTAQTTAPDPQDTATAHVMAALAPPAGVQSMTPEDAKAWVISAKQSPDGGFRALNTQQGRYAQRVMALSNATDFYASKKAIEGSLPMRALGWVGTQAEKPLDAVQRGLSTYLAAGNEAAASNTGSAPNWFSGQYWGTFFSGETWDKAWEQSKGISPGQAFFANSDASKGDLRARLEASREWGKTTWAGRFSTGGLDFAANVLLDPIAIATGGATKAAAARNVVKAGEAGDVAKALDALHAGEGIGDVNRSVSRTAQKLHSFIESTDGLTPSQMAEMVQFKQTSDPGLYAHLFGAANDLPTAAARWEAKRDIMATAIGDPAARTRLAGRYGDLDAMLQRVQTAPETNQLERFWAVGVDGVADAQGPVRFTVDSKGEIAHLNQEVWTKEVEAAHYKIKSELSTIERQMLTAGEVKQVGLGPLEKVSQKARVDRAMTAERTIYNSALGRTVVVVGGKAGAKAPNSINVADARVGFEDFSTALKRSTWLSPEVRDKWISKYAAAPDATARGRIVEQAEDESHRLLAAKYGMSPDHADALLQQAKSARKEWQAHLRGRAFSAADDVVSGVGPDGAGFAFDKAFLQSQLRDTASFMDPKAAESAMKFAQKHKITDMLIDAERTGSERLADVAAGLLATYNRTWKLSALFRVAYAPRVQVDTQLRNLAAMGALHWALTAGEGAVNLVKNYNPLGRVTEASEDGVIQATGKKASILRREQIHSNSAGDVDVAPARTYDEFLKRERMLSENPATLGYVLTDTTLKQYRKMLGNAEWDIVKPADRNWTEAYLRGVNNQIRNSTAARAVLDDIRKEEFVRLANKSGPLRNEWENFKDYPEFNGDPGAWYDAIRAHVDYMIRDEDLAVIARERNLTKADVVRFEDASKRFDVHGEAYAPTVRSNPAVEELNNFQQKFYRVMSDLPEQVMGRHPLYNYSFRNYMRDALDRWAAERPGMKISDTEIEVLRRQADSAARKHVTEVLFDAERMSPGSGLRSTLFPFFSAWEDTMKKWGRLFVEDPTRIRRAQQAFAMPANGGLVRADDESKREWFKAQFGREPTQQEIDSVGGHFLYLPKSFMKHFGISDGFAWRVDPKSFNIVFQGDQPWLPGPGPLVQIGANWVASLDPHLADFVAKNPAFKWILPYGPQPDGNPAAAVRDSLIPGWAKSLKAGLDGRGDQYADRFNQIRNVEFNRYYTGQRSEAPTAEEISRRTRNAFFWQAVSQNVMPVSVKPGPSEELQFYIDMAHSVQNQWREMHPDGQKLGPGDLTPEQIFYERYPEAYEMSIGLSENATGVQATLEGQTEAEKYSRAIANDPEIGWALAGPENLKGEFSPGVYRYQRSKGTGFGTDSTYRGKKDPRESFYEPAVRRGWAEYFKARSAVDAQLEANGITIASKAAAPLREALAQYRVQLANDYPGWGEAYDQQDSSKVESFIAAMQRAWDQYPKLKERRDMALLQDYVASRQKLHEFMKQMPNKSLDRPENAPIAEAWAAYVKGLTDQDLAFSYMYSRVLEGDDVNKELLGIGGS